MTAVQYENKITSIRHRMLIGVLVSVVIGVILGFGIDFKLRLQTNNSEGGVLLFILVPVVTAAVIGGITIWGFDQQEKRLRREHPEMEHLDEWKLLMGTAEGYPTDGNGTTPVLYDIMAKLTNAARAANASFAVRDRLKIRYPLGCTIEDQVTQKAFDLLAERAKHQNDHYLRLWNLFVDKLHILTGTDWSNMDPRKYREQFIHDFKK